ncbi:MAG: Rab family GTPase [Thermoplasmata archaeon]
MSDENLVKLKVCLIGESSVGKTSLIKRYVFNQFDDTYSITIGTNVTKKEIKVQHPLNNQMLDVYLMIWDLMGQQCFLDMLKDSYFFGARGLIAVCDITRENTLSELYKWMEVARGVTEGVPTVFLGNKCDLADEQQVDLKEIKSFASRYEKTAVYFSSVKTGFNVELAFKTLSEKILEDMV